MYKDVKKMKHTNKNLNRPNIDNTIFDKFLGQNLQGL